MGKHLSAKTVELQFVETLAESHQQFLGFLERRVGDRALAEDLLQAAYMKGIERGAQIRDEESAVAWFYRLLRNAVVDHYRRQETEIQALEGFGQEQEGAVDPELHAQVCACIHEVIKTLRPAYAEAVRQVDLGEAPLDQYARQQGITPNNAAVRLHRGRKALAARLTQVCGICATHGCLDCRCRQ